MDLVEDVESSDMCIIPEPEVSGKLGSCRGIYAKLYDIGGGQRYCIDVRQSTPGNVDFGARILAID